MSAVNPTEAELESFRQKWREEVSAKTKGKQPVATPTTPAASSSKSQLPKSHGTEIPVPRPSWNTNEEHDEVQPHVYPQLGEKQHGRRLNEPHAEASTREPKSALEHYEKAVERENQGSLGDSLSLYRKAFKLDARVHEKYKAKHFPPGVYKPPPPPPSNTIADTNPSNNSPTVPNPAHHSLTGLPPSIPSLLDSFSSLSIQGEAPPTNLSPPPPCPISTLPGELLVEILTYLAIEDLASFGRLSLVCKRFAFLVATEDRVWKRIAIGPDYGFAAMHYKFACQIDGKPLGDDGEGGFLLGSSSPPDDMSDPDDTNVLDVPPSKPPPPPSQPELTASLVPTIYPTFRTLFRQRPRIRFNGCYISTVNYTRPGAASPTAVSWNTPIHIVTYYRYLRFLRDGRCISLLTVAEPPDVVPYLSLEHVHKNHGALPSAPMKDALMGRWRLTGPAALEPDGKIDEAAEKEGGLMVETDGATPKYVYKMVLWVQSAGRAARSNKLAWQGYWSYNKLTDDVATFSLKNDRPFYWSRVRSWGKGYIDG